MGVLPVCRLLRVKLFRWSAATAGLIAYCRCRVSIRTLGHGHVLGVDEILGTVLVLLGLEVFSSVFLCRVVARVESSTARKR